MCALKKPPLPQSVVYGSTHLTYDIIHSRRKTYGIRVYPDGRVQISAPLRASQADIAEVVLKRAAWIVKHQQKFQTNPRPTVQSRQYVNGEMYRYLGESYTLEVVQGRPENVTLSDKHLIVTVTQADDMRRTAALIDRWYRQQAAHLFAERMAVCFPQVAFMGVAMPPISLRMMKSRWGSCSSNGKVTLNIKLLSAPLDLIDYVILHELCHLKELNHSMRFYALMDRVLPNWRECRKRLRSIAAA